MEAVIQEKIPKLIEKYGLKMPKSPEKEKVVEKMAFYIYNLVFNICALIATITAIYDPDTRKVKPKHIQYSLNYVKNQCYPSIKKMGGGSYHIDSDYFGAPSAGYSGDASASRMDKVSFESGVARPSLSFNMSGGQGEAIFREFSMIVLSEERKKEGLFGSHHLQEIFQNFDVKIRENSIAVVRQILHMHLNCFMYDLKEKGTLSVKRMDEVAKMARHSVFT